jgi:hypothetical protein
MKALPLTNVEDGNDIRVVGQRCGHARFVSEATYDRRVDRQMLGQDFDSEETANQDAAKAMTSSAEQQVRLEIVAKKL